MKKEVFKLIGGAFSFLMIVAVVIFGFIGLIRYLF